MIEKLKKMAACDKGILYYRANKEVLDSWATKDIKRITTRTPVELSLLKEYIEFYKVSNVREIRFDFPGRCWWQHTYDTNGLKVRDDTYTGNWSTFIYNSAGQLTRKDAQDDALETWETWDYRTEERTTIHECCSGYWERTRYNQEGLIVHFENSSGFSEKYEYNSAGLLTWHDDFRGDWTEHKYNEAGLKASTENSYGYHQSYLYDSEGRMIREDRSNGEWVKWDYNSAGQVIRQETPRDGWVNYGYDADGVKVSTETKDGIILTETPRFTAQIELKQEEA